MFKRPGIAGAVMLMLIMPIASAFAQGDEYAEGRNLVQRVQDDLHGLHATSHKDKGRIHDAMKHLSDVDRKFTKDKFSKGPLSDAIGDVQKILDHNTLETRERDALTADVHDLRELRLYKGK